MRPLRTALAACLLLVTVAALPGASAGPPGWSCQNPLLTLEYCVKGDGAQTQFPACNYVASINGYICPNVDAYGFGAGTDNTDVLTGFTVTAEITIRWWHDVGGWHSHDDTATKTCSVPGTASLVPALAACTTPTHSKSGFDCRYGTPVVLVHAVLDHTTWGTNAVNDYTFNCT